MASVEWDENEWALEEADKLQKLAVVRASADESAKHVRGLYVAFLLFAFYLGVTALSTTHEHLLKGTGARLPILDVELPLREFFIIAPLLVLVFHYHLLNHYLLLSRKLHLLNERLQGLPDKTQSKHRELPFPLVFSFLIVGKDLPGPMRAAFAAAVVVTMVVVPIATLLCIQWRFLPYHSMPITFIHQVVVLIDVGLLLFFWPQFRAFSRHRRLLAWSSAAATVLIAWLLVVPPGAGIEYFVKEQRWLNAIGRNLSLPGRTLVKSEPPPELVAAYKAAGHPPELVWLEHSRPLELRGRDLRGADLSRTKLWNAQLREANLQGASLYDSDLQGADLVSAILIGAHLDSANLKAAKLNSAVLINADLNFADLAGADLDDVTAAHADLNNARLFGARLVGAQLQSADLSGAHMQGTLVHHVGLQGADLSSAGLQSATLRGAELQGAQLHFTDLQGADFEEAQLQGASLRDAQLQGATFKGANLRGADLHEVHVYGTDFTDADLSLTDLRGVRSWPIDFGVRYLSIGQLNDPYNPIDEMANLEAKLINNSAMWSSELKSTVEKTVRQFWERTFDPPHKPTNLIAAQAEGANYERCGLFATWPPPPDGTQFEHARVDFVADLACKNIDIAQTLIKRVTVLVGKGRKPTEDIDSILAQAMLDRASSDDCGRLPTLVESHREKLERAVGR